MRRLAAINIFYEEEEDNMPTLEKVTYLSSTRDFCLTDCGPSEGCNPDDNMMPPPKDVNKEKQGSEN